MAILMLILMLMDGDYDVWRFPNRHPKAKQGFPNPAHE
jgi:hypothetical protein